MHLSCDPRAIVALFVSCDVVATVVQITGSALIGVAESHRRNPDTADHILVAGLAAQLFSFLVFLVLFGVFVRKARTVLVDRVRLFVIALALASMCVFLRTCFRLSEAAEGVFSFANTHEAFFGCLEFFPSRCGGVFVCVAASGEVCACEDGGYSSRK